MELKPLNIEGNYNEISKDFVNIITSNIHANICNALLLHEVEFFNILLSNYKKTLIIIVVIFTIVLPIIILLLLLNDARIKSLEMETVKERNLPLFYTILMMIIGFSFFKKIIPQLFIYTLMFNIFVWNYCFNNRVSYNKKMENKFTYVGCWIFFLGKLINMNIVFGNLFNWILALIVISGLGILKT